MEKNPLAQRVEDRLTELRIGPVEAATRVPGLERNYIRDLLEDKKQSFSQTKAHLVAQALDWTVADLMGTAPPNRKPPVVRPPQPANISDMPKDVPIMGNAAGGTKADFYFNGETIDYARRPAGIARASGVFALYVAGNSMTPRYSDGELIYATSARPASIGDYVVVEMLPLSDGADTAGYIKRLEKRTLNKVICSQFNPPKTLDFELRKIKAVHRVIPWNELLGV